MGSPYQNAFLGEESIPDLPIISGAYLNGALIGGGHLGGEAPMLANMKEKSALAIAIGQEIRRIRSEQHRSQESLADDCGINRTYMGNIERGEQDISVVMTKRIVSNLGVTLGEFFGKLGE